MNLVSDASNKTTFIFKICYYWYRKYRFYILKSSLSYPGATIPSVPVGFHSRFSEHEGPSTSNVCPDNSSSSPKRFGDEEANLGT